MNPLFAGRPWALGFLALALVACGGDDETTAVTDAGTAVAMSDVMVDDVAEPLDVPIVVDVPDVTLEPEDIELPFDLTGSDLIIADPDVQDLTPDTGFDGCPTLGITPKWAGSFEGIVTFDLDDPGSDTPSQGFFLVSGDLSFEISCLDQKLLVSGLLDGEAEAAGEVGTHPFAANLFGDFNYIDRTIDAQLLNGEVRLFKSISVYFAGDFKGAVLQDGTFEGTWDADHTGNDLNVDGDAHGEGPWTAIASP
jgi:hypothetical protein